MDNPVLSVIVCTYNGELVLSKCLTSLEKQSLNNASYEVLIIDNNSIDQSAKIIDDFILRNSNFSMFSEIKQGISHARNRGISESKGKYVAFIDDDAKASKNWCKNIINAFEAVIPMPISVGGNILPYYKTSCHIPKWFDDKLEIRTYGKEKHFLKLDELVFSGSNMSFPKIILDKYNGFNPDIGPIGEKFALGEEEDLYNRILIQENRLLWFDPNIFVYHLVSDEKLKINYRLNRAKLSGVKNFKKSSRKIYLLYFSMTRAIYYTIKLFILLTRFKLDYKVVLSLQQLISKWTTIKLIIKNII